MCIRDSIDTLHFQIAELARANLQPGEEEALEERQQRVMQLERTLASVNEKLEEAKMCIRDRGGETNCASVLSAGQAA